MNNDEQKEVFYRSKLTSFLFWLIIFFFTLIFSWIAYIAFEIKFIFFLILGVALFLFYLLAESTRDILLSVPYVILTKEGIILNVDTPKEVTVYWKDISGFRIEYLYFQLTIHIGLYDEAKYDFNKGTIQRGYFIIWNRIKKKDQARFIDSINEYKAKATNDLHKLFKQESEYKREREKLDIWYFLRAYAIALPISIILWFGSDFFDYYINFIIYTLIYPLAKITYDKLIGFSILHRIKESYVYKHTPSQIYLFILAIWIALYFMSYFLAFFGLLFLIVDIVHKPAGSKSSS